MGEDKLNILLIVADGISYPLFNQLENNGSLPNISRHITERKLVSAKKAIARHPASTNENMQSLLTGQWPNDPGAVYLNRETNDVVNLIGFDNASKGYLSQRRTVFHYTDEPSISIYNPWNDGATYKHMEVYSSAILDHLSAWDGANRAAVKRFEKASKRIKPKMSVIWFPSYDRYGHMIKSEEDLITKYLELDMHIGYVAKALKKNGQYDDTIIAFLSDHSMEPTHTHVSLQKIARNAGLSPKSVFNSQGYDSRVFAYGYSIGQIYLRNGIQGIKQDRLENIIESFLENEAIEHVIHRADSFKKISVHSKNSKVSINRLINYTMSVENGNNPFGYSNELVKKLSEFHSAQQSLEFTKDEDQPDAIVAIAHSMDHKHAPDLRLIAKPGYAFGDNRNISEGIYLNSNRVRNHGNLHLSSVQIPLIIAGPPVMTPKEVDIARNIDWMPTALEIAGYKTLLFPGTTNLRILDGESLI